MGSSTGKREASNQVKSNRDTDNKPGKTQVDDTTIDIDAQKEQEATAWLEHTLSPEEDALVDEIISGKVPIYNHGADTPIQESTRLKQPKSKKQWLNSEIIESYLKIACERHSTDSSQKIVFSSTFCPFLIEGGHGRVKRWGQKAAKSAGVATIFDLGMIIIPSNPTTAHWICTVVDMKSCTVVTYNSSNRKDDFPAEPSGTILEYLKLEHLATKGTPLSNEWNIMTSPASFGLKDLPKQFNNFDCGVFAALFGEFMMAGWPLIFVQHDANPMRRKMALTIHTRGTLY